jgi:8-oxo-dGTP pyrophosphatase MutT (NUDIX family)
MSALSATEISPETLRRRIAAASAEVGVRRAGLRVPRGDHELNPGLAPPERLTPAAVLVPVIDRPDGLTILLTLRTRHLAAHAGQIAFPGGRIEPEDRDPVAAALRETEEEIGLPPARVEIIGRLDTYLTRTGFEVMPVVGLVTPPFELRLDPHEVEDAFEVPLAFVLDPARRDRHSRMFNGVERQFWAMPFGERFIWGATAGMLVNLAEAPAEP